MRSGLAFLRPAALLFLLTPALAAASPAGLQGTQATVESATLGGVFGGAVFQGATLAEASFELLVDRGRLVVDVETYDVWTAPVSVQPNNTQDTTPLQDALFHDFRFGPECRVLVLATAQTTFSGSADGVFLTAATTSSSHEPRASQSRPPTVLDSRETVRLASQSGTLRLQAPFTLVLWDANVTLDQGGQSRQVQTGSTTQPMEQAPAGSHVQREAYIEVAAGTMTLPGAGYVRTLSLSTDGGMELRGPEGTLPVRGTAIPEGAQALAMSGPLAATLTGNQGKLGVAFDREPSRLVLDGTTIRSSDAPGSPTAFVVVVLMAVVLVAVPASVLRWRRGTRMEQVLRLMEAGNYGQALAQVRRLGSRNEEARLAQATCLIHQRQFADAQTLLEGKRSWSPRARPMRHYLLATVAGGQGRRQAAADLLVRCFVEAPAFMLEALANPLLAEVVKDALDRRSGAAGPESYA